LVRLFLQETSFRQTDYYIIFIVESSDTLSALYFIYGSTINQGIRYLPYEKQVIKPYL